MILYLAHYGWTDARYSIWNDSSLTSLTQITITDRNSRYGWGDQVLTGQIPLDGTVVRFPGLPSEGMHAAIKAQIGAENFSQLSLLPWWGEVSDSQLLAYPMLRRWAPNLFDAYEHTWQSGRTVCVILPTLNRVIAHFNWHSGYPWGYIFSIGNDGDTLTRLTNFEYYDNEPLMNCPPSFYCVTDSSPESLVDPSKWYEIHAGYNQYYGSDAYIKPASQRGDYANIPAKMFGSYAPPCRGIKYLIGDSSGKVYSIIAGTRVEMLDGLLAETFREYGMDYVPEGNELIPLEGPKVFGWAGEGNAPEVSATVDAYPEEQYVGTTVDLSDSAGVESMTAVYTGNVTVETSMSGGGWSQRVSMVDFLASKPAGTGTLYIRFYLSGNATLASFSLTYLSNHAMSA